MTTEDGSESATADPTEYFLNEAPTAISLVYFSANSTGMLAPLNNMIAVSIKSGSQTVTSLHYSDGKLERLL